MVELSHLNATGEVHMVEVGDRPSTRREARAEGCIQMSAEVLTMVVEDRAPKGNVLAVARVAAIQAAKRSVVAQSRNYWLAYSVREVIAMGQGASEIGRIDAVITALNMQEFAEQSVTTLSGGQAQRVDIARALIRESDIYLFDEPFSAQDSGSKEAIINIFKELRLRGKTILLVAHSDKIDLSWCDQIFDLGTQ